jgi:hypothetical protein
MHPHEGPGWLMRLLETGGSPASVRLGHPFGASGRATRCSAVEQPLDSLLVEADGSVRADVRAFAVVSVLFHPAESGVL